MSNKEVKKYRVETMGQVNLLLEGMNIYAHTKEEAVKQAEELVNLALKRLAMETSGCFHTEYTNYSAYVDDLGVEGEDIYSQKKYRCLHPNSKQVKYLEKWMAGVLRKQYEVEKLEAQKALEIEENCKSNGIEYADETDGKMPFYANNGVLCRVLETEEDRQKAMSDELSSTAELEQFILSEVQSSAEENKQKIAEIGTLQHMHPDKFLNEAEEVVL